MRPSIEGDGGGEGARPRDDGEHRVVDSAQTRLHKLRFGGRNQRFPPTGHFLAVTLLDRPHSHKSRFQRPKSRGAYGNGSQHENNRQTAPFKIGEHHSQRKDDEPQHRCHNQGKRCVNAPFSSKPELMHGAIHRLLPSPCVPLKLSVSPFDFPSGQRKTGHRKRRTTVRLRL